VLAISGRATFYAAGVGACGWRNTPGDFIVALNEGQYGAGCSGTAQCGRPITITYAGKSIVATVADCCPGCPYGALDMTEGLFSQFAGLGAGVFYMDWSWGDNSQPTTTSTPPPPPPSTTRTPTSTYTPPSTTSTPRPTTSSTWSSSSSSSRSSSSSSSSSESATSTDDNTDGAQETGPVTGLNLQAGNIHNMNQIVLQLGGLVGNAVAQGQ